MSENVLELNELEELKATYHLMDERLDGQEIVSDGQLREAMMRKFTDMRQNLKEAIIFGNLIFVPILACQDWARNQLTLLGIILLGVYWVASLAFKFVVLRKTKREDYGSYDLKTLVAKESRYSRNINIGSSIAIIFFVTYFVQMVLSKGQSLWVLAFMALAVIIPFTIRHLVIKYKYHGQSVDPATGKPRVLGGKRYLAGLSVIFGILVCLLLASLVQNVMGGKGLFGLMSALNVVPLLMAITINVLGLLHQKGKITVSRRLLIVLSVIAITLSATIFAVAMLMDFTELTKSTNLLMTACFSAIGLSLQKMRKK